MDSKDESKHSFFSKLCLDWDATYKLFVQMVVVSNLFTVVLALRWLFYQSTLSAEGKRICAILLVAITCFTIFFSLLLLKARWKDYKFCAEIVNKCPCQVLCEFVPFYTISIVPHLVAAIVTGQEHAKIILTGGLFNGFLQMMFLFLRLDPDHGGNLDSTKNGDLNQCLLV
ncbi:hypothetical protein OWV82_025338 [Melia azedarach]|uniref:Uncharacterized protein n=1 Tax=Melia azedarach TaxID=155640 RepID=A0ACC1WTD9_MELAZ|nr:hypothetical protein OWV82_025338 [Melia azedarach]